MVDDEMGKIMFLAKNTLLQSVHTKLRQDFQGLAQILIRFLT